MNLGCPQVHWLLNPPPRPPPVLRRAMAASANPSSRQAWICLHCCIVINPLLPPWRDANDVSSGAYAASAASTNAGLLAIPAYRCGVSHDHFCGFSAITFAGFHSIRNTYGRMNGVNGATTCVLTRGYVVGFRGGSRLPLPGLPRPTPEPIPLPRTAGAQLIASGQVMRSWPRTRPGRTRRDGGGKVIERGHPHPGPSNVP